MGIMSSEGRDARSSVLDASVSLPQHVVHRAFATETVILNLQTGVYHGLNPTGARMLEAMERTSIVKEAVAELVDEYGRPQQEIEDDLCNLCAQLLERGLIELSNSA
jgi:hypothetical protein